MSQSVTDNPKAALAGVVPRDRFSAPISQLMRELFDDLWFFGRRMCHVLSVYAELDGVTRGKTFEVHHEPMWIMALSERDMIVVDLASWAKAFYSPGGFLAKLHGPDLQALSWRWEDEAQEESSFLRSYNVEWRREKFDRLFPGASKAAPSRQDIENLVDRLAAEWRPLVQDRSDHRAHKYERRKQASAQMLFPHEVAGHLKACQLVVADLRALATNSSFDAYGFEPKAKKHDRHAQDVVDLILCGPINWIVEHDPSEGHPPEVKYYWQRREAYYERLHRAHEARGKPDEPFNALLAVGQEQ
jgi:hypothetical protein